jgi:hypothetical protein
MEYHFFLLNSITVFLSPDRPSQGGELMMLKDNNFTLFSRDPFLGIWLSLNKPFRVMFIFPQLLHKASLDT